MVCGQSSRKPFLISVILYCLFMLRYNFLYHTRKNYIAARHFRCVISVFVFPYYVSYSVNAIVYIFHGISLLILNIQNFILYVSFEMLLLHELSLRGVEFMRHRNYNEPHSQTFLSEKSFSILLLTVIHNAYLLYLVHA